MHILEKLKWSFYEITIKLSGNRKRKKKDNNFHKKQGQSIFLFLFLLFPVLQFIVFYVGVNFNSIILAFQEYENGVGFKFAGGINFVNVFNQIFVTGELVTAIKNSAIQFVFVLFLGTPVHVIVAYAVFKKVPFHGFFKVMLFLPQMISSMVFVICAEYLINEGFPMIFTGLEKKLLDPYETSSFWTVLIFYYWMSFASGLVVYLGAMGSIPQDVMEYGQLEKLSSLKELWYVVVPMIFPTITTYIVVAFAGFFTNYGFFYSFFNGATNNTPFDTLGYVFFCKVVGSTHSSKSLLSNYPYAAAGGIMFTMVCAPITIAVKMLLEKYGPSEE